MLTSEIQNQYKLWTEREQSRGHQIFRDLRVIMVIDFIQNETINSECYKNLLHHTQL